MDMFFDWYSKLCAFFWEWLLALGDAINWVLFQLLTFICNLVYALVAFMGHFLMGLMGDIFNYGMSNLDPSIQQLWPMVQPFTRLIGVFIPVEFCLGMFYLVVSVWVGCAPFNFVNRWVKGWNDAVYYSKPVPSWWLLGGVS